MLVAEGTALVAAGSPAALEGTAAPQHGPGAPLCAAGTGGFSLRLFPRTNVEPRIVLPQVMLLPMGCVHPGISVRGQPGGPGFAEGEGVSLYPGLCLVIIVHCCELQSSWRH